MPDETTRSQISFRFRGKHVALVRFAPDATLLDWLREEAHAKGTKEGCAEGDCGACTVVLRRVYHGALSYEPVNACILLLGQIDGAELLTIEDLAEGETLHPIQQAMVEHHGSQCGFCTPGIVMSLFAHAHGDGKASQEGFNAALSGNLCRCTGYRPILYAAFDSHAATALDRFAIHESEQLAALMDLPGGDLFVGDENSFFAAPASEDSLAALYARHPDATLVSGATDVGLWITKRLRRLAKVIWLGRVKDLNAWFANADGFFLAAGFPLEGAAQVLHAAHPDLGVLMSRFGSAQVRASGTIGGNIANGSPIGDLAPALIPFGAEVELRQGAATRRLALEDFFLGYGQQDRRPSEYVRLIYIPRLGPHQFYAAYKVSKRFDEDISAVMGAFRFDLDGRQVTGARVAYGGMAATPKRAAACEAALAHVDLDRPSTWEAAIAAIATDFQPLSDMRASAAYRARVAAHLVKRALMEASGTKAPLHLGELVAAD